MVGGNKKMNKEELSRVLELHKKWLNNKKDGKRADLVCANLSGADLRSANLKGANLKGADLNGADLNGAKTSYCVVNFSSSEYEQAKQFIEGLKR